MRVFVAIPLPRQLKKRLAELQVPSENIRWQSQRQFHITLKFIGEVSDDRTSRLSEALDKITLPSFSVSIGGWGTFPKKGVPRVIWVGMEPVERISQLQQRVEACCTSIGFDEDPYSFVPHITLGRVKGKYKKHQIAESLGELPSVSYEYTVKSLALFESQLSRDGAVYNVIKKYPLLG